MRGQGWYYTPISVEGQVVEKRVETIEVTRAEPDPAVSVRYTLTNPYSHPMSVPVQSGLILLYQYAQENDEGETRDPELHVVPATVTRVETGELLYTADEPGPVFGTTAIQRRHLTTGVPNYRHPITVEQLMVPGDTLMLQATASVPGRVERMILVDTMVGPDRRYGIYPQLLEDPSSEGRVPPPLRVYEGAVFEPEPPRVRIPRGTPEKSRRPASLPRWITAERFARLQRILRQTGKMWCTAVGVGAVLLSLSVALRWFIVGFTDSMLIELARTAIFGALTAGVIRGNHHFRLGLTILLALSAVSGLAQVALTIVHAEAPATILLTEAGLIPILYAVGSSILWWAPSVRAHAGAPQRRTVGRSDATRDN
ncbi:MAG: hypothetical protein ACOC2N_08535 [Spirochaetota bacterium]